LDDPDMRGAEKAIHRAALKARERADASAMALLFMKTGRL